MFQHQHQGRHWEQYHEDNITSNTKGILSDAWTHFLKVLVLCVLDKSEAQYKQLVEHMVDLF